MNTAETKKMEWAYRQILKSHRFPHGNDSTFHYLISRGTKAIKELLAGDTAMRRTPEERIAADGSAT